MMDRKNKQFTIWSDFVGETSLHGIRFVIHKNRHAVVKFLWTCIVISALSLLIFNLIRLYDLYKEYNFEIKTNVKFVDQFEFPAVTLCNTHSFDKRKINVSDPAYSYFLSTFTIQQKRRKFTENKWKRIKVTKDLLMTSSFAANDTILYAKYDEERIEVEKEFKMVFPTYLCVCYTYNGRWFDKNLVPKISAMNSVLKMYIDINQDRFAFEASGAGIRMSVHPYDEPNEFGSVSLSPGNHYDIKLSVKNYNYLPAPYKSFQNRNCIERQDISKIDMKYFPRYTFKACRYECVTDLILDACHCLVEFMVTKVELRYCSVFERANCVDIIIQKMLTAFHSMCNCTHQCHETVYELDSSSVVFPARSFTNYLIKNNISDSYEHARNNLIKITMSFKNTMIEEINHVPKLTIVQVISDLGGYMGFFLGASVLTLIEVFEVVYRSIKSVLKPVFKPNEPDKNVIHIKEEHPNEHD